MNERVQSEPPGLHPDALAVARASAEVAGLSVEEWISRTILENAGRTARAADGAAGGAAESGDAEAGSPLFHQLRIAEEAASAANMSVEAWLSRAILSAIRLDRRGGNPHASDPGGAAEEPALPALEPPSDASSAASSAAAPAAEPGPDLPSVEERLAQIIQAARRELDAAAGSSLDPFAGPPSEPAAIVLRPELEADSPSRGRRRLGRWLTGILLVALSAVAAAIWLAPKLDELGLARPPVGTAARSYVLPPPQVRGAGVERLPVPAAREGAAGETSSAPSTAAPADALPTPPAQNLAAYEAAAGGGNVTAQVALARMYLFGDGVPRDYAKAARWYLAAARAGDAGAQYALAVLLERGLGVEKDPSLALKWYARAAAAGHLEALNNLGIAYYEGTVAARDYAKAFAAFRPAAEGGLPEAQFNLGLLYDQGRGVARDPVEAYLWYARARAAGERKAAKALERLALRMTPEQIARAKALLNSPR